MDLMQIGKFIAELRKEQCITQEQLGEKIGVTNKTVSRWETGTYLPPAKALLSMSEIFDVSINELLSGKRLNDENYKAAAEENLKQAIKASSFSLKDKVEFFKKKWLREHVAAMCCWGICILAVFAAGIILEKYLLLYISLLLLVFAHAWRNNTMMAYVEQNAYTGADSKTA